MKSQILFSILALLILATSNLKAQLYKVPFEQKQENSKLIIEGRVIGQASYIANEEVYTENLIEVKKVLKGEYAGPTLKIITMGGEVEGFLVTWTHLASLCLNEYGIFFLNPAGRPLSKGTNTPAYDIYSSSQGVYRIFHEGKGKTKAVSALDEFSQLEQLYARLGYDYTDSKPLFELRQEYEGRNCITFKIEPRIISSRASSTQVEADIFVKVDSSSFYLYRGNFSLKYDTVVFGKNIVENGYLAFTEGEFDSTYYNLSFNDLAENHFEMELKANTEGHAFLETVDTAYKKVATVRLNILGWHGDGGEAMDWDSGLSAIENYYLDEETGLVKEFDCTKVAFSEACPNITKITPLTAAAGVGLMSENGIPGVITIKGTDFTDPMPEEKIPEGYRVKFKNAGTDGEWIAPFEGDYISWTDTEIKVKVPSVGYKNNCDDIEPDSYAGTGKVRVTKVGLLCLSLCFGTSSDELYVPFTTKNTYQTNADGWKESVRTFHPSRDGDNGFSFYFTTKFKNVAGAVDAFKRALETWRCATFINFDVRELADIPNLVGAVQVNFGDLPSGVSSSTRAVTDINNTDDCGTEPNVIFSYLSTIGMIFREKKDDGTPINWHTAPSTPTLNWDDELDLETIALHEIGHAHLLRHTKNSNNVMFPSANQYRRMLTGDDENGGDHIVALNTTAPQNCPPSQGGMIPLSPSDCGITSVIGTETESDILVLFPNPAKDKIAIQLKDKIISVQQKWQLVISNNLGKSYQKRIIISGNNKPVEIDISDLPSGVYFTEIINNEKTRFVGKFIKI